MKMRRVTVHNFRCLKDVTFLLGDYTLVVGENNSGKTCLVSALRAFYEQGGAKYAREVDFPKMRTEDQESWVETEYSTTDAEQESLKEEYRSSDGILRVRRYFQSSEEERVRPNQSNIYAYEHGKLSSNLFYGAKNISQAKLGGVVYIPEVSKPDETLKLSGPSPFRDMVNFVMKRAVLQSVTYKELEAAFEKFNLEFKKERSRDGFSVDSLTDAINKSIASWGIRFGVDVNTIRPEEIVKNLLTHFIEDQNLPDQRVNLTEYGQGLQRHLIYTLIRLSVSFAAPRPEKKRDFSPELVLLLFEEPEAFLHPSQQNRLNWDLRALAVQDGQQVLITTHSPLFVSKSIRDLPAIVRFHKPSSETHAFQVTEACVRGLTDANLGLYKLFCDKLADPCVDATLKKEIRTKDMGHDSPQTSAKLEEEGLRYFLWLNAERASLFFARHVLICEGATEKVLLDYLVDTRWQDLADKHIYFLDAMGKYNVHRYIGLLSELGIEHSALMDKDCDTGVHGIVNGFVSAKKTHFTNGIHWFDGDLESFLGIDKVRSDLKPINVILKVESGAVPDTKLEELRRALESLL